MHRWFVALLLFAPTDDAPKLPATPRQPLTEQIHGQAVADDYRWLEKADDPTVRRWLLAQNRHSRVKLDAGPVAAISVRFIKLLAEATENYEKVEYHSGRYFALRDSELVTFTDPNDVEKAQSLFEPHDPDAVKESDVPAPGGKKPTWLAVDLFAASPDGKKVAVTVAADGAEEGYLRVIDVPSGDTRDDRVPLVSTPEGGHLVWATDSAGFFYTRHPHTATGADRYLNQQVYYHKLGTPADQDEYLVGKGLTPVSQFALEASEDGKWLLAGRNEGLARNQDIYLIELKTRQVTPIATPADRVVSATFGPSDTLLLLTTKDADRGRVLKLPLAKPAIGEATVFVPQGERVITALMVGKTRLYLVERWEGAERVRVLNVQGETTAEVPVPAHASVREVVTVGDDALLRFDSYLQPTEWVKYAADTGKVSPTKLTTRYPFDFADAELVRERAKSADGAQVPMTILRRKDCKLDGTNPVLLTGYGGFAHDQEPAFDPGARLWLDAGGVLVVAHCRGDGELGAQWHRGGTLLNKQRTFDDFIACAEHLIAAKYTTPAKLGIQGGSNGGLLIGAVLTQRPELFGAVVCEVGIHDLPRLVILHGGRSCVPEYGSPDKPDEFQAMLAYSPYHHVRDGVRYPPTLIRTGFNDGRVAPAHSWKFAARLQAANAGPNPVLLWTNFTAGHNDMPAEALARSADYYGFMFQHLGMKVPASQ